MSAKQSKKPRKASAARDELISIQQRWVEDLKNDIYHTETRHNPRLDRYYEEYRQHFQDGYEGELSRKQIGKLLAKADIAYFGDYHTLKLAQTTFATLVEEMAVDYAREVVIGLEMVESKDQRFIDDFMNDRLSEEEFLIAINYQEDWGFPWQHYARIFKVAKANNLRVVGLNLDADGAADSLDRRDAHAAKLIAALRVFHPEALIAVLFGDLHVAECHIPRIVSEECRALSTQAKSVIFYQNSETLYWELVDRGRESAIDAVRIRPNVYCLMNATPLMKFQSWVGWMDRDVNMEDVGKGSESKVDLSTHFFEVVQTINDYMGLDAQGIDDFKLHTHHDFNLLDRLAQTINYSAEDVANLNSLIREGRSLIIPETRHLYLSSFALNESAWLAARFLRLCLVGVTEFSKTHDPKDAFYVSVFDEALGTVGTLVMNPRYRVMTPKDHEEVIFSFRGRRNLARHEKHARDTSRAFLDHHQMMLTRLANSKSRSTLRSIYRLEAKLYLSVTRAIGRFFGAWLFHDLQGGKIQKSLIADLFHRRWEKGEGAHAFMDTAQTLGAVPDILRPISQSL